VIELHRLERATLSALDDAISAPPTSTSCTGSVTSLTTKRTEGASWCSSTVTGEAFGSLLQDERRLRLVAFNSLRGWAGSHVGSFSGVASSLVEYGIPAVVGMRFEISDEAAITFAGRVYRVIAQRFPIDAAMAAAAGDAQAVVTLDRKQTPTTATAA
jgi:hypothetical protein